MEKLKGKVKIPFVKEGVSHAFHQFTIMVPDRDKMIAALKEAEVGFGIFYPKPLHLHPHFMNMGYAEGDFPVAEKISKNCLSLPVHPSITEEDVDKIVAAVESGL